MDEENYAFDNEFFALVDKTKPIGLKINYTDVNSLSSFNGDKVHIGAKRGLDSAWERKKVIYHEYRHCIDAQREL